MSDQEFKLRSCSNVIIILKLNKYVPHMSVSDPQSFRETIRTNEYNKSITD